MTDERGGYVILSNAKDLKIVILNVEAKHFKIVILNVVKNLTSASKYPRKNHSKLFRSH